MFQEELGGVGHALLSVEEHALAIVYDGPGGPQLVRYQADAEGEGGTLQLVPAQQTLGEVAFG